jgi:hypothetical protein
MKRHWLHAILVITLVFVALSAFTPGLAHIVWPGIAWTLFAMLVLLATGLVANLLYAFFALEMGYDPKRERSRRSEGFSSHVHGRWKTWLHVGALRHR